MHNSCVRKSTTLYLLFSFWSVKYIRLCVLQMQHSIICFFTTDFIIYLFSPLVIALNVFKISLNRYIYRK